MQHENTGTTIQKDESPKSYTNVDTFRQWNEARNGQAQCEQEPSYAKP